MLGTPPLPRLRGRVGAGALSAMGFAERAPTRLALLGTLPREARERGVPPELSHHPLAAPAFENRLRMRIDRVSQTSR
jgi:hypothetical protein